MRYSRRRTLTETGARAYTDFEFFALGQMEVTPKMMDAFQKGSGVVGPYGFIIDLDTGSGS